MADSEYILTKNESEENQEKKKKKKSQAGSVLIRSKAIVEKKLAILKSALNENPKSVPLAITRLNLSKEILDSSTLNRQWKELIFLFPGNIKVWDAYLCFLTSHFTTFKLSKITEAFKNCVKKLKQMAGEAFRQDTQEIEQQLSHILIRLAHLWCRAGYRERSVALFQVLF
jgi:hypothetical protein